MSLDAYQQVTQLAMAASALTRHIGTEQSLQATLEDYLPKALNVIGDWSISWGPKVWKENKSSFWSGPDNAWFAVTGNMVFPDGQTYSTCVVAIGATAVLSKEDWEFQDFNVEQAVDFGQWTSQWPQPGSQLPLPTPVSPGDIQPNTPYISKGTSIGVYELMNNTAPAGTALAGQTLGQYIASLQGVQKLIFTGHSLGGALAPTLALCMAKATTPNLLRHFDIANVLVYPLAGASPGDQNLANLFNQTFPAIPSNPSTGDYQVWNCDLFNVRDIVPQAWCQATGQPRDLSNIPGIYGNHAESWSLQGRVYESVMGRVEKEISNATSSGVTYQPIQGQSFEGNAPGVPVTFIGFLLDALQQHVAAYVEHLKLQPLPPVDLNEDLGIGLKTMKQRAMDFPVLRYLLNEIAGEGGDQTKTPL